MIKIFGKIRKCFLMDGAKSKYLKYAIGEIVLVVIGILIALSINNWSEERMSNKQIHLLLGNLVKSIEEDIGYLNWTANLNEFRSNSLYSLLKIVQSN